MTVVCTPFHWSWRYQQVAINIVSTDASDPCPWRVRCFRQSITESSVSGGPRRTNTNKNAKKVLYERWWASKWLSMISGICEWKTLPMKWYDLWKELKHIVHENFKVYIRHSLRWRHWPCETITLTNIGVSSLKSPGMRLGELLQEYKALISGKNMKIAFWYGTQISQVQLRLM